MTETEQSPGGEPRWILLRDVCVVQVKLVIDGLRDLILVPASLVAGLISIATHSNGAPGTQFYRLLHWGKRTERWINLFGALDNAPEQLRDTQSYADGDIDSLVSRVESLVVEEYRRGGVTAQAKQRLDKVLDALQRSESRTE